MFHVEQFDYLPKATNKTLMSDGETPLIREACAILTGCIDCSFSRASKDKDFNFD